ncbi:hypothetical protein R9C00_25265 [Flammeovirgaceae bacterium SG7u.111]|nr:hypothetical protein [Flammeovirgaceae bacterium SG7u.132]WPO35007.1 hypothetical protein R9C00_25265 [Flammeovirgaceae bacterium SG7u.111]
MPNTNNTLANLQEHQYKDLYHEDDVPLNNIGKKIAKLLIVYGIVITLISIVISCVVIVPNELDLTFELRGGRTENIIQFQEDLYVKQTYVTVAQPIKKGQPLVTISSPRIVGLIADINEKASALHFYVSQQEKANHQETLMIQTKIKGTNNNLSRLRAELAVLKTSAEHEIGNLTNQVKNIEGQHNRITKLYKNGAIAALEYDVSLKSLQEAKYKLIAEEENYNIEQATLRSRIEVLQNELANTKQELESFISNSTVKQANLEEQLELSKNRLALLYGATRINGNAITLLSEADGHVTLLTESEIKVPSGQILVRVQTDTQSYYAYALAEPKDIGLIGNNILAVLKFEGLPHYYYGTMKAEVVSTSESPDASGKYPVRMNIHDQGQLANKVRKGMRGTASVVIEERPIIGYLLRAFLEKTTFE